MEGHSRWTAVIGAILVATLAGVVSFNAGVSHGLALAARGAADTAVPYGWYRPWGFGPFGPLLFVLLWFLLLRTFWWGGFHRRRWYGGGPYDAPPTFEEWHRRAHERMSGQAAPHTDTRA